MADGDHPVADPRIYLAAERTFLAWVRTSISLMGFGFLVARFAVYLREEQILMGVRAEETRVAVSPWLGFAMVCFGVVVSIVSAARYRGYVRALDAGEKNPRRSRTAPLFLAGVLALVGLAMAVHLLSM